MVPVETLVVVLSGVLGNALVVWAVVRPELGAVRAEVRRAHDRIDEIPHVNFRRVK